MERRRIVQSLAISAAGLWTQHRFRGASLLEAQDTSSPERLLPLFPLDLVLLPHSSELLFPHLAIGSGCEMQFVLFSGRATSSSGTIYFFDQNGTPLSLALRQ